VRELNRREKKEHYDELDRYIEIAREDSLRAKIMNVR
jgi:hypothetical protein